MQEDLCPHSFIKESRCIAIFIDKLNAWFPPRDYQDLCIKDFIEVLDTNLNAYKFLLKNKIEISKQLTKQYNPKDGVIFNISYNTENDDYVFYLDTMNFQTNTPESHIAVIYHTYDSLEAVKNHKIIKHMGKLSPELIDVINKNNKD